MLILLKCTVLLHFLPRRFAIGEKIPAQRDWLNNHDAQLQPHFSHKISMSLQTNLYIDSCDTEYAKTIIRANILRRQVEPGTGKKLRVQQSQAEGSGERLRKISRDQS